MDRRVFPSALLVGWLLLACGNTEHDPAEDMSIAGSTFGGAPPAAPWPLIEGEGECPEFAPTQAACSDTHAKCIYPGLQIGSSPRAGEVRCDCVEQGWLCVVTDQRFQTDCPLVPWTELREKNVACPADPELDCLYWVAGNPFGADCGCEPVDGAAGGAADREWQCGL